VTADEALAEPLPPAIGKYRPIRRIGVGAMGAVYLCSQPGLGRPVAVKVMIAGQHASPDQIRRFQREAWAAAQLAHPNVLQIHDVGSDGPLHYFVMEFVDGSSLDRLVGSPELTMERALDLVRQVAGALDAAHARGIIHRDVKPSNILIDRDGRPKLADFGLAKALHDGRDLSGSGDIIGTPLYMAPEQALAAPEEVDGRVDIYSLGAVLYELLTGRPPVEGPNTLAILKRLIDEGPTPVRERSSALPEAVALICERATARDPADRFASAAAFAGAIESYVSGVADGTVAQLSRKSRPGGRRLRMWSRAAILVGGLGIACLIGLVALNRPTASSDDGAPEEAPAVRPAGRIASRPPDSPVRSKASRGTRSGSIDPAARAIDRAREVLQPGGLIGATAPRDRLRALLEDLTSALKESPEDPELRIERGSTYLRAGDSTAAAQDFAAVLRRAPADAEAIAGRLLANYQLHILYLGNLNEPVLRPLRADLVQEDVRGLLARGDLARRHLARMIDALARQDYDRAGKEAESGPQAGVRPSDLPDFMMVEADALFHAAERAYAAEQEAAEGPEKDERGRHRREFAHRANSALRRGLDAAPTHVGLLFLQADSFQRLAVGDPAEGDDRPAVIRRQRFAFDAALDRLRQASLSEGCAPAVARAVLLSNFGREKEALDRIHDALSYQPTVPYLQTFKAWLRLQGPPDGILSAEEADRIAQDDQAASERPREDYSADFVRALLRAAAGRWEDARRELRSCRRKLGSDSLPTGVGAFGNWYARANEGSFSKFLYATQDLLDCVPVTADLHVRLAREVLGRLDDAGIVAAEGLAAEAPGLKGWTHFRLAASCANQNDRQGVLEHVKQALGMKLADLVPKTFRDDPTFRAWNENEEFRKLYQQFEAPKAGPDAAQRGNDGG
jgi:tetratricopeptide (TPR) repeat protein